MGSLEYKNKFCFCAPNCSILCKGLITQKPKQLEGTIVDTALRLLSKTHTWAETRFVSQVFPHAPSEGLSSESWLTVPLSVRPISIFELVFAMVKILFQFQGARC